MTAAGFILARAVAVGLIIIGAVLILPDLGPEDCGRGEERPRRPITVRAGWLMIVIGGMIHAFLGGY